MAMVGRARVALSNGTSIPKIARGVTPNRPPSRRPITYTNHHSQAVNHPITNRLDVV
ncbi:hypothetical protein DPMN_045678 [Dreissena polymorpha]|uniref:Uncharacterized protein n=1 Tax=Dreissena polymorpha TaxID=45954 RepID=A0A9D4D4T0_DREPO|nr:hypothetical protein DPMN_045678 [Dreissena polymorpha]